MKTERRQVFFGCNSAPKSAVAERKFPVFSLMIGEFYAESSLHKTASSGTGFLSTDLRGQYNNRLIDMSRLLSEAKQSDKNDGFPRLLTTPQLANILPCPNLGSMSRPASANCFLKGRALCPLSAGRREKLPLRQNSRGTRKGTSTATTPGTTPNGNAGTAGLHLRPRNAERAETHARRAVERPKPSPTNPFSLVAGLTKPPWANGESG